MGDGGTEILGMNHSKPKVTCCETSRRVGERSLILLSEGDMVGMRSEVSEDQERGSPLVYSLELVLSRSNHRWNESGVVGKLPYRSLT